MSKITKRKYVEQEVMEFVLPAENQQIVKVTGGRGNNLHEVVDAQQNTFLVSMPCKFRKNIWIKRGDFIIIDPIEEGDKVKGEIAHILFPEHIQYIQEEGLWPEVFGRRETKVSSYVEEDMLPPSDSEEEDLASMIQNANRGSQLYEEHSSEEEDCEETDEEDEDTGEEEKCDETEEERKGEDVGEDHLERRNGGASEETNQS